MKTNQPEAVKILWTGGWDSTFRLCQLILTYKKPVEIYYLVDPDRLSVREEFIAQRKIRQALLDKRPDCKELLGETKIFLISDLKPDPKITETYNELIKLCPYGTQYEWLALFCFSHGISKLELCAEKFEGHVRQNFIEDHLEVVDENGLKKLRLNKESAPVQLYNLFQYFDFPLKTTTREDMKRIAEEEGFLDIMHLTWFCHTPIKGIACGLCNPCKDAVIYNFGYRLSFKARLRYWFRYFSKRELVARFPLISKLTLLIIIINC